MSTEDNVPQAARAYVYAWKQGDRDQKTPFRISVNPDETLELFLGRVSERFSKRVPVQFSRVFAHDSELLDTADIQSGETLYFSAGEDRLVAVNEADNNAEKIKFLEKVASAAVTQAAQIYDSTSSYIVAKSPEFIKVTLEKVQGRVEAVANPVARKVKEYGQPVLEWADGRIDSAYNKVSRVSRRTRALPAEVVKTINDNYVMPVLMPIKHRVDDASEYFVKVAADTWHSLQTQTQDKRVRLDSFVDGLKTKLGSAWSEKLAEPARNFYATVVKEFDDVLTTRQPDQGRIAAIFGNAKTKLGTAWEQKVKASIKMPADSVKTAVIHRVVEPAEAFYRYASEGYRGLSAASINGGVTFSDFLVSLRGRLGSAWNSALLEPARYLYERFRGESHHDEDLKNVDDAPTNLDDVPTNTSSPVPTSQQESPEGSGNVTPPNEEALFPSDAVQEEPAPVHVHEEAAPKIVATSTKTSGKKKGKGKK